MAVLIPYNCGAISSAHKRDPPEYYTGAWLCWHPTNVVQLAGITNAREVHLLYDPQQYRTGA